MTDFEFHEQEFRETLTNVNRLIGEANYSNSRSALQEAQDLLIQCKSAYKQMKLAANSNASLRVQLRPKLSTYKKSLDGAENDCKRAARSGLFGENTGGGLSADTKSQRKQMSDNTERLRKQRETLEQSNQTLNSTQDVALNVMDELARNRQTIQNSRGKARKMLGGTDRARWIVGDMSRRNTQTKIIACCVFVFVLSMIGVLIWQVTKGPDSPAVQPTITSPSPAP
jgi:chromosome segregation ATPase